MKNTKRISWTILVVFLAAISFLKSSSAMSSSPCDRGRPPENQLRETRHRHGAHGKQIVRKVSREIELAAFFDDSTVMYASGNSLFLASIREGGPELEFRGHTDIIHDYKVEPGRKRIVTASEDGTLRLWDSRTGECLAVSEQLDTLSQPGWTMLLEIVYHPNGRTLMTSDMEGMKVWDASDLKLLSVENSDLFYMAYGVISPDWKTVSCPVPETYDDFAVYERGTEDVLLYADGRAPVCYSRDGKHLLAASYETGAMEIWDVNPSNKTGRQTLVWLKTEGLPLKDAAFSPDGRRLVSAHEGGVIRIWDTRDGAEKETLQWDGMDIDGVSFDPRGVRILAIDNDARVFSIWGVG